MDRRRFLGTVTAAVAPGFAGCGVLGDGSTSGSGLSGASFEIHPAGGDLENHPSSGTPGGHVVVSFVDPSCPSCKLFHDRTLPDLQSGLVDAGAGAYVSRVRPIVYQWGELASKALEAVFDRDPEAYWTLLDHYFENQSTFGSGDVLDDTESFLASETDLDATAIVDGVRAGSYDAAVQADLDAADSAGLPNTTPAFVLFRDGKHLTTVRGPAGYDSFAAPLGLP